MCSHATDRRIVIVIISQNNIKRAYQNMFLKQMTKLKHVNKKALKAFYLKHIHRQFILIETRSHIRLIFLLKVVFSLQQPKSSSSSSNPAVDKSRKTRNKGSSSICKNSRSHGKCSSFCMYTTGPRRPHPHQIKTQSQFNIAKSAFQENKKAESNETL